MTACSINISASQGNKIQDCIASVKVALKDVSSPAIYGWVMEN
ncbi:MAG: DUF2673 domain-containing protein [Planctomycetes bacterium]|nr:DUF2673 domain-containing protein [Planctomycetota bacterium]